MKLSPDVAHPEIEMDFNVCGTIPVLLSHSFSLLFILLFGSALNPVILCLLFSVVSEPGVPVDEIEVQGMSPQKIQF